MRAGSWVKGGGEGVTGLKSRFRGGVREKGVRG